MIAMRYGCVPIARNTGGLSDTILDSKLETDQTGFLFDKASPEACEKCIERALNAFINQPGWQKIQKNGMKTDLSWKHSAKKYADEFISLWKKSSSP